MKRAGLVLMFGGGLFIAAAVAWWWMTYRDVITYAYLSSKEAGYCLIGETDICALARALCRGAHPLAIINYSSLSLWVGLLLLCAGLTLDGWRKPQRKDGPFAPEDLWY
jgi:hypothetical protein